MSMPNPPQPAAPAPGTQEPDVLLDVSELKVAKIDLEVDGLRAHVSLQAELANLLRLSVGVDARLDRVKLVIEGVEAKVLLKVRLRHVRAILEKALDTVAEHPEILETLGQVLSDVVRESLTDARATLEGLLDDLQVGDTVDEALRTGLEEVRTTLDDVLEGQAPELEGQAPELEGQAPEFADQADEPPALGEEVPGADGPPAVDRDPTAL
jgi:hypothetical protein